MTANVAELLRAEATAGVAAFALAIVFAWSGIAKTRRPALAATAIRDFGLTARLSPTAGRATGIGELTLAAGLAAGVFPVLFRGSAALLLVIFALLIARSLARGDRFACFCFGGDDAAISAFSLLRTLALASIAAGAAVSAVIVDQSPALDVAAVQAIFAAALVGTTVLAARAHGVLSRSHRMLYPDAG